jgi:hypothetical protein
MKRDITIELVACVVERKNVCIKREMVYDQNYVC